MIQKRNIISVRGPAARASGRVPSTASQGDEGRLANRTPHSRKPTHRVADQASRHKGRVFQDGTRLVTVRHPRGRCERTERSQAARIYRPDEHARTLLWAGAHRMMIRLMIACDGVLSLTWRTDRTMSVMVNSSLLISNDPMLPPASVLVHQQPVWCDP